MTIIYLARCIPGRHLVCTWSAVGDAQTVDKAAAKHVRVGHGTNVRGWVR